MDKKIYKGEVGDMWQASYALIDRGDGVRCAWCEKKVDEIGEAFIDEHIDAHIANTREGT